MVEDYLQIRIYLSTSGPMELPKRSDSLAAQEQHWTFPAMPSMENFGKEQLGDPNISLRPWVEE